MDDTKKGADGGRRGRMGTFLRGYARIMRKGDSPDRQVAWAIVVALALLALALASALLNSLPGIGTRAIRTDELLSQMREDNVAELSVSITDGSASGTLREPLDGYYKFTSRVNPGAGEFERLLYDTTDIEYDYSKPSFMSTLVANAILIVVQFGVIFGGFYLLMRDGALGEMISPDQRGDIGVNVATPDVSFSDVVGIPEAIEEVSEIVSFLQDPAVYKEAGAKPPRGILLQGPAGCGKTLLARALAGEAGVPFISQSGSDFIEMYVGVGAKRMRKVFKTAREVQPSIVFIDEIDAIGGDRDATSHGSTDEHLQTINQLLTEMDGFDNDDDVIVIGATNRGASLDPALLRPGRFDRIITVDQPAREGRMEILQHYAVGKPFADEVDFERLASHTYGFSAAQLESVMNQAATLAARRAAVDGRPPAITSDDIEEGMSRVISGPAMRSKQMSDREKRYVAYHEAGHATVQYLLPGCDDVQKISIVSRNIPGTGMAMGYVQSYSEEDSYITTSEQCEDELAAYLAGRAAENMFCGVSTAGAADDLRKASALAMRMAGEFSFSPYKSKMTEIRLAPGGRGYEDSDEKLRDAEKAADAFMSEAWSLANEILADNADAVEGIVAELLEHEVIDSEGIEAIMSGLGLAKGSWGGGR